MESSAVERLVEGGAGGEKGCERGGRRVKEEEERVEKGETMVEGAMGGVGVEESVEERGDGGRG